MPDMATSPKNNGLYKSVDGGKNWRQLTNVVLSGDNVGEWISLAIAGPSSPETLYTTVFQRDNSSETPMLQRFLTTDAGTSWSMLNPPASISDFRSAHVVLAVDPNSPTVVYANAHPEHLFVSTDSGQNWTVIPQLQDPVNVYFDSAGEVTYVTDQGINRVLHPHDPDQTSLVHKQGNLGNFLFYNVTLDPRNPHSGFGISQDHIPMLQFTGQPTWISAQAGNEVGKVLIDPHDPDVVYNRSPAPPWGGFVQRSTDGGMHWHRIFHGIDMSEFSTALPSQPPNNAFALDEHQPSRLVLGGRRVWQTLNRGDDWSPISHVLSPTGGTDGEPATITAIAVAPSQGDTMYAATEDGRFFATFDGGRSN
jgi:photosystem II stability/assembly factor-like uncharacterized protein